MVAGFLGCCEKCKLGAWSVCFFSMEEERKGRGEGLNAEDIFIVIFVKFDNGIEL